MRWPNESLFGIIFFLFTARRPAGMSMIGLSRTRRKVELRSAKLVGENALDANVACSGSNYALNALAEDYSAVVNFLPVAEQAADRRCP